MPGAFIGIHAEFRTKLMFGSHSKPTHFTHLLNACGIHFAMASAGQAPSKQIKRISEPSDLAISQPVIVPVLNALSVMLAALYV